MFYMSIFCYLLGTIGTPQPASGTSDYIRYYWHTSTCFRHTSAYQVLSAHFSLSGTIGTPQPVRYTSDCFRHTSAYFRLHQAYFSLLQYTSYHTWQHWHTSHNYIRLHQAHKKPCNDSLGIFRIL